MLNIKKNLKKTILAILAIVIFNNIFLQTLNSVPPEQSQIIPEHLLTWKDVAIASRASRKFISCFEQDGDIAQSINLNLVEMFGPERIVKEGTTIAPMGAIDKLSTKDFTLIIEKILNSYITEASKLTDEQLRSFGLEPEIPLNKWVEQIITKATIPRILVFCALIYLEKTRKEITITKNNVYRLFLIAIMLASKVHEDKTYNNSDWSKIGLNYYEIIFFNSLEIEFCKILNFKLLITEEELQIFLKKQYLFIKDLLVQNPHKKPEVSLDEIVINIQ